MRFNAKDRLNRDLDGYITRQEREQMEFEKRKASSTLRQEDREAFGVLVEESNWLGPGKLHDIIRQQY